MEAEVADRVQKRDEAARMLAEAQARERNEQIAAEIASGAFERRRQQRIMICTVLAIVGLGAAVTWKLFTRRETAEERADRVVQKFAQFTDETCACKDKACVDEVQNRLTKWAEEMAKNTDYANDKPDYDIAKRMETIVKRYTDCYTKAYTTPAEAEPQPYRNQEGR